MRAAIVFSNWLQTLNIRALNSRINRLEQRMATNDELVTRLRTVTDTLAAKLRRLSQGDPRFEPIIAELEAMGVDDTNPLPEPVPEPPTA